MAASNGMLELPYVVTVPTAFLCLFIAWFAYYALLNPLAHLPGPRYSQWTNLRLQLAVMTGERTRYVQALHERYGSIVRISPYEVSLASVSAAKTIYKFNSPFLKTKWYNEATRDSTGLFTLLDPKAHSARRRMLAHTYSEGWISKMEPYMAQKTKVAVAKMQAEMDEKGYCDVNKWFIFMATDIVTEAAFGEAFGLLELGKKNQYIHDLEIDGLRGVLSVEFPYVSPIASYLLFGTADGFTAGINRMKSYAEDRLAQYWKQYHADPDNVKPTLMTRLYTNVEEGTLTHEEIRQDAGTNIIAGTDTTSATATFATWYLSQNAKLERALIDEISTLPVDFTDEHLKGLKLLDNVIKETLRIRSPVGQALPRAVPVGGAFIDDCFIPEGTVVGIPAYSMHRLRHIWRNPETFDPSRWEEPSKEMKDSYVPFGGGSRICIGMHFAQLELRHALANFYRAFPMGMVPSRAEGFTADDMTPMSFFITALKGKRCLLARRE